MANDLSNQLIEHTTTELERSEDAPVLSPQVSAIWIYSHEPDSPAILETYLEQLAGLDKSCELIVVINGDSNRVEQLKSLVMSSDLPARMLQLHRTCDESTAMRLGLESSRGEILVLLPSYVQSDPGVIEQMIDEVGAGADYVASWRHSRIDSRWSAFKSRVFNDLTRYATGVDLHDINSGLRVMKSEVPKNLPIYGDLHRFLPVLAAMHGFRVSEIKTRHIEERVKKGDYAFGVYIRRLLDLMTLFFLFKFTKKPLRFFGLIGSFTAAAGFLISGVLVVERLFGQPLEHRPALLFGILLIVLGVNLVSLGLLGELIIFIHGHRLRDYHVKQVYENINES